ncbi:putative transcription factor bHLH family [Lupinus albus]|uniref:Putative transcription factor bHLH family n=1 Tax=Lupinus albus TaxID=3870 RepID=A0A6A4QYS8_LUPAL|nr:putative transcription factor bHLH family [Lupinus albus]
MNMIMQNITERVRPLVGLNGWDYCVYWKLSEDQRYVEWLGCCCAGTENNNQNDDEEQHLFPFSSVASSCRDTIFPHPTIKTCHLLSQLPISIPLDSGIHAQTLLTNQPNWVNYSKSLDSNILEETIGTKVLIPVPGGLVELFVAKQVPEDLQVIDFITTQCIVLVEQETVNNHSMSFNIDVNSISNNNNNMQSNHQLVSDENEGNNNHRNNNHSFPLTTTASPDTSSLPHDISLDRIGLCNSSLNFMHHHQFNYNNQGSFLHDNNQTNNNDECMNMNDHAQDMQQYFEPLDTKDHKQGQKGSDSMSDCSDQNEEEDDGKYRRRNGKGNQSKNLVAERKRRKKLNDRLYNLRSLVPRISKLDRASILGDAIEYVKDLQKQVKDLQDELEENSDTGDDSNCFNNNNHMVGVKEADIVNGAEIGPKESEHCKTQNGFHVGTSGNGYITKQKQEVDASTIDKQTQQMEPQVEVAHIDGNEYFVKVFSEHKMGGFVKLMEALNTLGMDVVHATVTSHKGLVSNVFKVEKKDSEMVEAEDVRESLLELTRNPCKGWNHEMTATSENGVGRDQHHLHNNQIGAYHHHHYHT